jgi:hypothetical protein
MDFPSLLNPLRNTSLWLPKGEGIPPEQDGFVQARIAKVQAQPAKMTIVVYGLSLQVKVILVLTKPKSISSEKI